MKSFYEFYLQMQREAAAAPAAGAQPAAAPAAGAQPAAAAPAAGAQPAAAAPAAGAKPAAAGTAPAQGAKVPSPNEVKAITDLQVAMKKVNVNAITDPERRNQINAIKQQIDGMATQNQQTPQAKPGAAPAPAAPAAAPQK